MNQEEYCIFALRTAPTSNISDLKSDMIHASLGIGGESGEILDIVKKHAFYGKPLDRTKLLEEIGDLLWYVNLLIHNADSDFNEVFEMNIRKLEARYPDLRFDANKAINRDTAAEAAAMEKKGT